MAITATVAAVAGTVYVADKMGDAANAQKEAASRYQGTAQAQATAITDQTEVLRQQLDQQRAALEQQALQTQSLLTQQQGQFESTLRTQAEQQAANALAQQNQFETLLTQQSQAAAQAQAAQSAQYEQMIAQQREQAAAQAQLAEEARNRANQKKPASEAFIAKNERQGMSGQSGTLLTGTSGVSSTSLPLGRATLLGA